MLLKDVIILFIILLAYSLLRKKWAIASYLLSVYLFTFLVALSIESIFPFYTDSKPAGLLFASAILFYIIPYFRAAPQIVPPNATKEYKIIKATKIISFILLFLDLLIIPAVITALHVGFEDLRQGGFASHYTGNFITSIAIKFLDILNPLSFSILIIFFYLYTFTNTRKKTLIIIFIASLSAPYYGIVSGGRTQMIYWLLSLGFNISLFYTYLDHNKRRLLTKNLTIIVGSIFLYLAAATIARFANSDWGTENSLLIYIGQPYLNFGYFVDNYPPNINISLERIFPLTNSFINGDFDLEKYRDLVYSRSGMDIGIFYTFLGDFFVDIGVKGIYIYSIIYFIVATYVCKRKTIDLSFLLLLGILFLIPLQGIFYYSFWKKQVTFCALLVWLFSRYIKSNQNSL